jgi:hypothetical protein
VNAGRYGERDAEHDRDALGDLPDRPAARRGIDALPVFMEMKTHLRKAAALAAANGVSLDEFADAAWEAFLDAKPGLRDEIELRALAARLGELRERGLVGSA